MLADIPVPAKVQEYASTSMKLKTRDEIFSAMVVYGFQDTAKRHECRVEVLRERLIS